MASADELTTRLASGSPHADGGGPLAPAASVVLLRGTAPGGELEVLLVQRERGASFMASAVVFPGGRVEPEDGDAATAAIRELFEEAGVLLASPALPAPRRAAWRRRLLDGEARFAELLAAEGLTPGVGQLRPWSRWVTPAVEPRRFDAQFFVATGPPGDAPTCDARETVAALWLTPRAALVRWAAGTLALPPPQIVTLTELAPVAAAGVGAVAAAAAARPDAARPILPRGALIDGQPVVLLPWDPDYAGLGIGAAGSSPEPARPAGAPGRFALTPAGWVVPATGAPR